MNPWPHQIVANEVTHAAIAAGRKSGLWIMPTGTGKTGAFTMLAKSLHWPTLVLVHRDELIRQTLKTLGMVWPEASTGVIQGERNEWGNTIFHPSPDVVVASVLSLHPKRREQIPPNRFGLIIADEAHHAVAQSWLGIFEYFESRFLLGCTATPDRLDGLGLCKLFGDEPLYTYPLRKAIEDGHLCQLRQYAVPTNANLDKIGFSYGDWKLGELELAVNTPERNAAIVKAYQEHAADRRAIAFAVDVKHATDLRNAFRQAGISSAVVSGETPTDTRRQILEHFSAGKYQVITNCAVLTEGFDDPGISCVLMARPTNSRALYAQCVGRGLRLHTGKDDCLVLDFVDVSKRHKLVTILTLLGCERRVNADGANVLEVADEEVAEVEAEAQDATYHPLTYRTEEVSPWPELPNLIGYQPWKNWHDDPASGKQRRVLARFGLIIHRNLTKGEASWLMDRCFELEAEYPAPATGPQKRFLSYSGHWHDGMSKAEANKLITRIKSGEFIPSPTRHTTDVMPPRPPLPPPPPPRPPARGQPAAPIVAKEDECPF